MTKQVALSEPAYLALRRAKRERESFSDVVLRLLVDQKDPRGFTRRRHRFLLDAQQHLQEADEGRAGEDPYAGA